MTSRILPLFFALLAALPASAQWATPQPLALDSSFNPVKGTQFARLVKDLDGDRRGDMVMINSQEQQPITIHWTSPQKPFGPDMTTPLVPIGKKLPYLLAPILVPVNLNGDAFPDLVILEINSPGLLRGAVKHTFINSGGRAISFSDTLPFVSDPRFIRFADLDNDGDDDMLGPCNQHIISYTNNGGVFSQYADTLVRNALSQNFPSFAVGILNSAVGPEIIAELGPTVYRRTAGVYAQAYQLVASGNLIYARFGDLNGDGRMDFMINDYPNNQALFQDTSGRLRLRSSAGAARGGIFTDLNGDGRQEIVSPGDYSAPNLYLSALRIANTGGITTLAYLGPFRGEADLVGIEDMDADGLPDLIAGSRIYTIFRNLGNFQFAVPTEGIMKHDGVSQILPAISEQRQPGVLATGWKSRFFIPRNPSPGTGTYRITSPVSPTMADSFPEALGLTALFDADGDGRQEFSTVTPLGSLTASIRPDAAASYSTYSIGGTAARLVDIEGQGRPTLATIVDQNTEFEVRLSRIQNGRQQPHTTRTLTLPLDVGFSLISLMPYQDNVPTSWIFDMDGDRKADLVIHTTNRQITRCQFMKGNGDGTFQAPVAIDLPIRYVGQFTDAITWQDLDGNGLVDAFSSIGDSTPGSTKVCFQVRPGVFRTQELATIGLQHKLVGAADVNRDGHIDLVVRHLQYLYQTEYRYDHKLTVFWGDGRAGFRPQGQMFGLLPSRYDEEQVPLALYDLNADGYPDIVGRDGYSGAMWMENRFGAQALLSGFVHHDRDADCRADTLEPGLAGWLVRALPTGQEVMTAADGSYQLTADTATTALVFIPARHLQALVTAQCRNGSLAISGLHAGSQRQDTMGVQMPYCHQLSVSLNYAAMPICAERPSYLRISNLGLQTVHGVQVTVRRVPGLAIAGASVPYTQPDSLTIQFSLDSLTAMQEQIVTLTLRSACSPALINQSLCLQATATPASNCTLTVAGWDGSTLVAGAQCVNGRQRFVIRNEGAAMADSSTFQLIAQDGRRTIRRFILSGGDSLELLPVSLGLSNALAKHLLVQQRPGHPNGRCASASSSDCSIPGLGLPAGLVNTLPLTDLNTQSTVCIPIRTSFDPNDKQVQPAGEPTTLGNLVPTQATLRYTIRFENMGSDTAYRVVVVDSLPADLDEASVKLESASHPFTLSLRKIDATSPAVLTFTSGSSMALPYRAIDSVRNQGYVSFSAYAKPGTPQGTVVSNVADIYFDFNPAIRTNAATVTLSDTVFGTVTELAAPKVAALRLHPNPATDRLHLTLPNREAAASVELLNAQGRHVRRCVADTSLSLAGLPTGYYIVRVRMSSGRVLQSGFSKQ